MGLDRRPDGLVQVANESILRATAEEPYRPGSGPSPARHARGHRSGRRRATSPSAHNSSCGSQEQVAIDAAALGQPPDAGAPNGIKHLVGVERKDPVAPRVPERQVVRRPEVTGPRLTDDPRPGGSGELRSAIGGARVHHHDLVDDGPRALDARAEESFLVARDDAQRDRHRPGAFRRRSIRSRAVRAACRHVHRPRASPLARSPRAFISAGWS